MASEVSSFEVEKYSFSSQPIPAGGVPSGDVAWQHHPARENLYIVFDTRRDTLVKVIHGKDVKESLNIRLLLEQRVQPSESPLVILIRSPSIAFKFTEPGTRKVRRFQVRIIGEERFQEALDILKATGCLLRYVDKAQQITTSEAERPMSRPFSSASTVTHWHGEETNTRNFRPFIGISTLNQEPAAAFGYKPQQQRQQHATPHPINLNHSGGTAYPPRLQDAALRPVSAPMFYSDDAVRHHGQYNHHRQHQPPQQHQQYTTTYSNNHHQHQRPPSVDSGISSSSSQDYYGNYLPPSSQSHQNDSQLYLSGSGSQHFQQGDLPPPTAGSQHHRRNVSEEFSLRQMSPPIVNARARKEEEALIAHHNMIASDPDMMADDDVFGVVRSRLVSLTDDGIEPPPKRKSIDFEAAKKVGGDKPLPSKLPPPKVLQEGDKKKEIRPQRATAGANKEDSAVVVPPARKRKAPTKKGKETPLDVTFKKAKSTSKKEAAAKEGNNTSKPISFVPSNSDDSPPDNDMPDIPTTTLKAVSAATNAIAGGSSSGKEKEKAGDNNIQQSKTKFDGLSVFLDDPMDQGAMETKLIGLLHDEEFIKLMERLEPLSSRMTIKHTRSLFKGKPSSNV